MIYPPDEGEAKPVQLGLCLFGFAGVFIIVRPGGGLDTLGVTFALLTALLTAIFHLMTRVLSQTETSHALFFTHSGQYALLLLVGTLYLGGLLTQFDGFWFNRIAE